MSLTVPQNMAALERANDIRMERADLRRTLKTEGMALLVAASVITDPAEAYKGMSVFDLLVACRRVGPARTRRWMLAARVSEFRKLGDLTARERSALTKVLEAQS